MKRVSILEHLGIKKYLKSYEENNFRIVDSAVSDAGGLWKR